MHPYALALQTHLTPHADPLQAGPMKAYMRDIQGCRKVRRTSTRMPRMSE